MYIRFVSLTIDPESHQLQGIFRTANTLGKSGSLNIDDEKDLEEIFDWFNKNLPVPDHPYAQGRAIFWFVDSASEHIKKMWELTNILRSHGCNVEVRICRLLYNIRYQDNFQVAAYTSQHDSKVMIK